MIKPLVLSVVFGLAVGLTGYAVGKVALFVTGMQNPQHLLPLPDGSLLASDSGAGVIYHISRSSSN